MIVEFPVDNHVVRRYVEQLPPRTRGNTNAYCCLLGQFIRFVSQRSVDGGISREMLQAWFRHRMERLPIHSVLERVSLLDHFLDWLVAHDLIATNPFAELRRAYGEGKRPRIVKALLRPDADAALDALRPVPRFASHLGVVMQGHVDLMRALGLRCRTQEGNLLRFDRFLQRRADLVGKPLAVLVDE